MSAIRVSLSILGTEVLALELGTSAEDDDRSRDLSGGTTTSTLIAVGFTNIYAGDE